MATKDKRRPHIYSYTLSIAAAITNKMQRRPCLNEHTFLTMFRWVRILWFATTFGSSSSSSPPAAAVTTSSSSSAFWQTTDSSSSSSRQVLEESTYQDLPPTIFSPTGRLHSVERVMKAATTSHNPTANLLVAVTCRDGLVVVSTVPVSPHLNITTTGSGTNSSLFLVNETTTPILVDLGRHLVAATAGNAVDGQVLRQKLQSMAENSFESQGEESSVRASELARRLADHLQVPTQTVGGKGGRMLAVRIQTKIARSGNYLNYSSCFKRTVRVSKNKLGATCSHKFTLSC
jgi:hypothetical protein